MKIIIYLREGIQCVVHFRDWESPQREDSQEKVPSYKSRSPKHYDSTSVLVQPRYQNFFERTHGMQTGTVRRSRMGPMLVCYIEKALVIILRTVFAREIEVVA